MTEESSLKKQNKPMQDLQFSLSLSEALKNGWRSNQSKDQVTTTYRKQSQDQVNYQVYEDWKRPYEINDSPQAMKRISRMKKIRKIYFHKAFSKKRLGSDRYYLEKKKEAYEDVSGISMTMNISESAWTSLWCFWYQAFEEI